MTIMIETTTREEQDQDHQRGGGEIIRFPGSAVALAELADGAREYVAASLAPATRRAYRTDWRLFSEWCTDRDLEPLPAAPATLVLYLTDMATRRSVALLQRRLTSISQAHQTAGYETPTQDPAGCRRTVPPLVEGGLGHIQRPGRTPRGEHHGRSSGRR